MFEFLLFDQSNNSNQFVYHPLFLRFIMSDQAQQSPVETANPTSPAVEKTETQRPAGRLSMPQDVRYCTEQDDRVKLAEKYEQYKVSDVDACHVRFLTDNRQKRNLFGQNEGERHRRVR